MSSSSDPDRDAYEVATKWSIEESFLRITVRGRAPSPLSTEVIDVLEARCAAGDRRDPLTVILDVRAAAFGSSGQEIRRGAHMLDDLGCHGRIGVLVSSDFQHGLVRMIDMLASGSGLDVAPFRSEADAHRWLHGGARRAGGGRWPGRDPSPRAGLRLVRGA